MQNTLFKKAMKIEALILILVITLLSAMPAYAKTKTKSSLTGKTYTSATVFDKFDLHNGIDVSYYNGNINWNKVKKAGIDFVIIRAGYTGYSRKHFKLVKDSKMNEYINGAYKAGLDVGIYWFSQAITVSEAKKEADKCYSVISKYKDKITLPVYHDYEYCAGNRGRLYHARYGRRSGKLTKASMTKISKAFCDRIQEKGFIGGIYASKNFLEVEIDGKTLGKTFPIWVAHYNSSTPYSGDYNMWQYSSSGRISGEDGRFDCNFMYTEKHTEAGQPLVDDEWSEGGKKRYTVTKPAAVKGVKVSNLSDTARSIKWTAQKDVDGYQIRVSQNKNFKNGVKYYNVKKDKNSLDLKKLKKEKTYYVSVRSYKAWNDKKYYGAFSDTASFFVKDKYKVRGLKKTSAGKKTIKIKWNKVPNATKYQVYLTNTKTKKSFTKTAKTNSTSLNKLARKRKYKVKVRAYSGGKWRTYSNSVYVTTK